MAKHKPDKEDFQEIGLSVFRTPGGRLIEDRPRALQGDKAHKAFQDMADNCSLVGAFFFVVGLLIQRTPWVSRPADEHNPQAVERAMYLDSVVDDMSHSFGDALTSANTSALNGWAWLEMVIKRRLGPEQTSPMRAEVFATG